LTRAELRQYVEKFKARIAAVKLLMKEKYPIEGVVKGHLPAGKSK
jgi:hypothetical protein